MNHDDLSKTIKLLKKLLGYVTFLSEELYALVLLYKNPAMNMVVGTHVKYC